MIFSLSEEKSEILLPEHSPFDIICFFHVATSAITCPKDSWFHVLEACLRNKREVLILDSYLKQLPATKDHQRWQWGEGWMCLQPRALSTVSKAYPKHCTDIVQLRQFLSTI